MGRRLVNPSRGGSQIRSMQQRLLPRRQTIPASSSIPLRSVAVDIRGMYIHTSPASRVPSSPKRGRNSLPALFVRSGTSNGLVLRASDLPSSSSSSSSSTAEWARILPAVMGSPDPVHGRQLDGMGGGISSTSKVCVLAPSARANRDNADVDFTFVQVGIRDRRLDTAGNCGNMSAVVGPVAWDWGFVPEAERAGRIRVVEGGDKDGGAYREALVRIFNTNTGKTMHARFRVDDDEDDPWPRYCPAGDYAMDGVPGTQSRITLGFADPAGAKTGRGALPTGNPVDVLALPGGGGAVRASLVDVSNPGVFVELGELGLGLGGDVSPDTLTPAAVEADAALKARLEAIRRAGAARMGLDPEVESVPKVVLLFPRGAGGEGVDVQCLAMSMGQAHKAVPLTLALCLGAAANIDGTVAAQVRRGRDGGDDAASLSSSVVIGHPSGTVEISTTFENGEIVSAELHRTARILMKGEVYY
ncbi:DUF453-domain-containing protein [Xylaria palmicola]|nr:DUF453-domain-containing protein [Xylaria palmicola]